MTAEVRQRLPGTALIRSAGDHDTIAAAARQPRDAAAL